MYLLKQLYRPSILYNFSTQMHRFSTTYTTLQKNIIYIKVPMSVCAAKSMLMAGAILPGGARAEATDECLLPAAILAQDLVALRVLPQKGSSVSPVSG